MGTARIGIVDDVKIALRGAGGRITGGNRTAEFTQHTQVHRDRAGLGNRPALAVEYRAGGIQGLGNDRRPGTAQQHVFHLVGYRGKPPAQHLEPDGVERGDGFPVNVHAGMVAASRGGCRPCPTPHASCSRRLAATPLTRQRPPLLSAWSDSTTACCRHRQLRRSRTNGVRFNRRRLLQSNGDVPQPVKEVVYLQWTQRSPEAA